jgi:hypothetical protein
MVNNYSNITFSVAEESKGSSSWSQKPAIGHGLNQVNPINVFESNLSKTQFRLCMDFQSGIICTLTIQPKISYLLFRFIVRGARPNHLIRIDVINAAVLSDECKYAIT